MASQGFRVMAVAFRQLDKKATEIELSDKNGTSLELKITFCGWVINVAGSVAFVSLNTLCQRKQNQASSANGCQLMT